LVEIHDCECSSYKHQQQNYSDAKNGKIDARTPSQDIVSPYGGINCHYCDLIKCMCCMYEMNYYYSYGLSRRKIRICNDCYIDVYGSGTKIPSEIVTKAFSVIHETIMNSATVTINLRNRLTVNYFDAVRCAFNMNPEVRAYLGENSRIDKNLRRLWSFTYAMVSGRDNGIEVLNRDPDNLILSVDCKKFCLSSDVKK
jgi:hypothetical protein